MFFQIIKRFKNVGFAIVTFENFSLSQKESEYFELELHILEQTLLTGQDFRLEEVKILRVIFII
jgi:hypothetical protein